MSLRTWLRAETAVLTAGTLFAWSTIVLDYRRFFGAGGRLFQFRECVYPNPLTTPCFYGAVVFAIALGLSLAVARVDGDVRARRQEHLTWLLLAGVLFAWINLGAEVWRYYGAERGAPIRSCSGTMVASPFVTPCFFGAVLYLAAFAVALRSRGLVRSGR